MDGTSGRIDKFKFLYFLQHLISVVLIVLLFKWVGFLPQGFNWHPFLMTLGMVILYGNSILIYRGFRHGRKISLKLMHAKIHGLAFAFTVYGLYVAFDSHSSSSPHFYSLHSWIGLSAVILFASQYVAGLFFYLFPVFAQRLKIAYMPVHIFFGLLGFVFALIACMIGICEKSFNKTDYNQLGGTTILVNSIGLLLMIYASLVIFLVTNPSYKREPLPEEVPVMQSECEIL